MNNNLMKKLAHIVKPDELQKYAVVIVDGGDHYGLYDISSDDGLQSSINKLAINEDGLPEIVRAIAMGVINTVYMAKTGSRWPLFIGAPVLDDNRIAAGEVDWTEFELKQKNADKVGFIYNGIHLPLDTPVNINAACDFMNKYGDQFEGSERVKFANEIVTQAEKHGTQVGNEVEKYASNSLNPLFYELMKERIKLVEDYPETLNVLKQVYEDAAVVSVDKTAESLQAVDAMLPFSMKYGSNGLIGSDRPRFYSMINIPDAYEVVYGVHERPLTFVEKVANLDDKKLKTIFSDVFIERLRTDPERTVKNAAPQVKIVLTELVA